MHSIGYLGTRSNKRTTILHLKDGYRRSTKIGQSLWTTKQVRYFLSTTTNVSTGDIYRGLVVPSTMHLPYTISSHT